jgi:hypothetical protein
MAGVERVGLAGDHLRTISSDVKQNAMENLLGQAGISVDKIERGEPTLEDVFLALAR